MDNRPILHKILVELLGSKNVYFNPPESVKMKYPGIRYSLNTLKSIRSDNKNYLVHPGYELVLIDCDPDSEYVNKLTQLPYCSFVRYYTADGLNHWVFNLYHK